MRLPRRDAVRHLAIVADMRSAEHLNWWTSSSIAGASQAVLLAALVWGGEFPKDPVVGVVICCAGSGMAYIWGLVVRRILGTIMRLESIAEHLETSLRMPKRFKIQNSPPEEHPESAKFLHGWPPNRIVLPRAIATCFIIWLISAFYFLVRMGQGL